MLGIWKNIEDLENSLNLPELEIIVKASREKEERHHRFLAAIQGIDLDAGQQNHQEKFEEVKRRVAAKASGISEEELEFQDLGIDIIRD